MIAAGAILEDEIDVGRCGDVFKANGTHRYRRGQTPTADQGRRESGVSHPIQSASPIWVEASTCLQSCAGANRHNHDVNAFGLQYFAMTARNALVGDNAVNTRDRSD
jgi:hypothetical protein